MGLDGVIHQCKQLQFWDGTSTGPTDMGCMSYVDGKGWDEGKDIIYGMHDSRIEMIMLLV